MSNYYEKTESKIIENTNNVLSIYFKDFLHKFDSIVIC